MYDLKKKIYFECYMLPSLLKQLPTLTVYHNIRLKTWQSWHQSVEQYKTQQYY